MANTVRWKVPFVSRNGTSYRIDIYDKTYSGNAITLTGASDVFTTDEENSEDFFSPVRAQTGTLRLVDTDGSLLEQLLPENNTHRFMRLVNVSKNEVSWQGFLSCEVYSQTYTACTQVLDISVNSVLAAMESIQLDNGVAAQFKTVQSAIADVFSKMESEAGIPLFDYIVFPKSGVSILGKYFNMATFFDKKEQCNEDTITYTIAGISSQEMLQRVCQFMGWTIRECGRNIHFCAPDDRLGMLRVLFADFKDNAPLSAFAQVAYTQKEMRTLNWTGNGHTKSIAQGAKSVEVVANLSDYEIDTSLPECPVGHLEDMTAKIVTSDGWRWWYMLGNTNDQAYSNLTFAYYKADLRMFYGEAKNIGTCTLKDVFEHKIAGSSYSSAQNAYSYPGNWITFFSGAFLCKSAIAEQQQAVYDAKNGLHVVFLPGVLKNSSLKQSTAPIFTMDNIVSTVMNEGYIKLNANAEYAGIDIDDDLVWLGEMQYGGYYIVLSLQFGDKYWNGTAWQSTACTFEVMLDGNNFKSNWTEDMKIVETEGHLIPISETLSGAINLKLWPMAMFDGSRAQMKTSSAVEITFHQLEVDHVVNTNNKKTERKENHYFRLLGVNFSDEKFIDFQLGSDLNNLPSPSTPMEDIETPITKITFVDRSGNEVTERPELNLLDRACRYYKQARRMVELEIARPTGDLATYRFKGYDEKDYVPLAESRDWAEDSSTVRCFEMPDSSEN